MSQITDIPLSWQIHRSFMEIAALAPFSMNEPTLAAFQRLLGLLSKETADGTAGRLLADPYISALRAPLRHWFAQAAYLYEQHWAEKIITASNSTTCLEQDYPYYDHYHRATRLEWGAVHTLSEGKVRRLLMVGSGPLPMTSMILARQGVEVTNLDISGPANQIAQQLLTSLEDFPPMKFITADLLDYAQLADFDAVWLAALAGTENQKCHILKHLQHHMKPGAWLLTRTATRLRTLLYPEMTAADLSGFNMKLKIDTYADNYHSMLIAQR